MNERDVIKLAWRVLTRDPEEVLGLDDASALKIGERFLVLNVDMFDEETDLLPGMTPEDVGWKALVAALSDVAAKGARPRACLVSVSFPKNVSKDFVERFYEGLNSAAKRYKVGILGGDTSFTSKFYVAIVAFGFSNAVIPRGGANTGDVVVTTGEYGLTSAAYLYLLGNFQCRRKLTRVLKSVYRPEPQLLKWVELASYFSSTIDSSDGLALSLHYIAEASNKSIVIEDVPIAEDARACFEEWGLDPLDKSLYEGGEEYELIATIPRDLFPKALARARSIGLSLYVIGHVKEGEGVFLRRGRSLERVEPRGWLHRSLT